MDAADLIWMNGEFVAWEDAKVHVLTHGLHYGTGVFEGIRCYETEIGPAVFRHADHLDRLYKSAELYYMPIPFEPEQLRAATLELIGRNGFRSCYIRPLVFRGYGTMGLFPLDAPVDVCIAVVGVGPYLGEEGKRTRRPRQGLVLAAHQPRLADPARQGLRPVPQLDPGQDRVPQGRLRGGDPARRQGPRLRGLGREHLRGRATASISTPPQTASILDGINRKSVIQIARDLGFELVERDIARAELYLADEVFVTGTATELAPVVEIDDHRIGDGAPGAVTRAVQSPSTTRCTAATSATASGSTRCQRASPPRRERRRALRRDPARRDAGPRDGASAPGEGARRAQARRARRPRDRGRLPGLEPQGARAVRAAGRRAARARRDRGLRHDPPPRRRGRRGPGAADPGRRASRRSARSWARPGACTSRRSCASTATGTWR